MVRTIFNFIGDLLSNWYIVASSIVVAFLAAVLDSLFITTWLYDTGLYASFIFGTCLSYIVIRTLVEALIGWVKKW